MLHITHSCAVQVYELGLDWYRLIVASIGGYRLVMARYSHKGHDSIRYDITQNIAIRYDTIRKCFTVCKNRKQASNSA